MLVVFNPTTKAPEAAQYVKIIMQIPDVAIERQRNLTEFDGRLS